MKNIKAKAVKNLNYNFNRTKIEGCTSWNGLYGFGNHNKPKRIWSCGSVSPPQRETNYVKFYKQIST